MRFQTITVWRACLWRVLLLDPADLGSAACNPLLEANRRNDDLRDRLVVRAGSLERRNQGTNADEALLIPAIPHVRCAEDNEIAQALRAPSQRLLVAARTATDDEANDGIQRRPELPGHEAIVKERPQRRAQVLGRRMSDIVRQALIGLNGIRQ
jgi:hypothetical protein